MAALINFLIQLAANPAGQAAMSWLAGLLWGFLKGESKELIAEKEIKKAVENALEEYERIIQDQIIMAKDGLDEKEKEQIRMRKAAAQARIINARP